ncbi:hypothetical protein WR25_18641 [Diploscapter pachys]|uniref:Uncharacterized protein n=1 Tax=Diploscapter pachys TaxID=2018661 RepID=A0A2A2M5V6_9BILA|nr:hypothetical protein WR25_18641 [Diploscapter pachys]
MRAKSARRSSSRIPRCSRTNWTSTRRWRSCWSPKASARWKRSPMSSWTNWPASRASTRTWRRNCRAVRRKRSTAARPPRVTNVVRWVSRTRSPTCRT